MVYQWRDGAPLSAAIDIESIPGGGHERGNHRKW